MKKNYIAPKANCIEVENEALICTSPGSVGVNNEKAQEETLTGGYRSNLWGDDED